MGEKAVDQIQSAEENQEEVTVFKDDKFRTNTGKFYRVLFSQALPKWLWVGMWAKLPADVMLQATGYDQTRGCHYFILWSDKFPVTDQGGICPELTAIANQAMGTVDIVEFDYKTNMYVERNWDETPSN